MEGEEGGPGPPKSVRKGEAGGRPSPGRDVTWMGDFPPGVRGVVSVFVSLFCFFSEGCGGKEIGAPPLDGRTLHFGAGKCRLGTGLSGKL